VTEIYHRWQSAEKYLSPTIDFLPQLLIVSILLFVIGLIDNLFSISASLDGWSSWALFTASKVCSVVFGAAVISLAGTIVHAIFRPLHSPFASTLTNLIIRGYMRSLHIISRESHTLYLHAAYNSPLERHTKNICDRLNAHITHLRAYGNTSEIQTHHITAYHNIMSQTYDDNLLDDGSSALKAILQVTPDVGEEGSAKLMIELVAYLFTPAASRRSAMTAARAIHDYKPSEPGKQIEWLVHHHIQCCDDVNMLLDKTVYDDFHLLTEYYPWILEHLVRTLQATDNSAQVWSSPSMHALYTFAYHRASSAYSLKDASNFPFHYLWLLWSTRWFYGDGYISPCVNSLCNLMSRAITDPTSNYRPEDVILSVKLFLASSRVIGEAELRVFFHGMAHCNPSIIDDPAGLLFLASLTLKLCQQSNVSTLKIFTLSIQAGYFSTGRLLHILPLLRSLFVKRAPFGDHTAVGELVNMVDNLTQEISPEMDAFIEAVCSEFSTYEDDWEADYAEVVSLLSLLTTLGQSHLAANQITYRLPDKIHLWLGAFKYFDEHRESAYLHSLPHNVHFGTCSGQSYPSTASPFDSSTKQTVK
jgi:hypothetical protein